MNPTDTYVYYEDLDNPTVYGWKRNNDNLMWRYWAAKEMAETIIHDAFDSLISSQEELRMQEALNEKYPRSISKLYLIQILKKEWFR